MKRLLTAAAVVATALSPMVASAETGLKGLFQREQSSLNKVSSTRLQTMLTGERPTKKKKAKQLPFAFSRAWVDAQPEPQGGDNWRCLSEALYFEARGETVRGQFAVAEVIMNRVKSARFPSNLCGVIRQGTGKRYQCQFTYTCDGHAEVISEPQAFERVSKVARAVMDGVAGNLTAGATHYHTTAVKPRWANVYKQTAQIGVHIFYRHNYRTASTD